MLIAQKRAAVIVQIDVLQVAQDVVQIVKEDAPDAVEPVEQKIAKMDAADLVVQAVRLHAAVDALVLAPEAALVLVAEIA